MYQIVLIISYKYNKCLICEGLKSFEKFYIMLIEQYAVGMTFTIVPTAYFLYRSEGLMLKKNICKICGEECISLKKHLKDLA